MYWVDIMFDIESFFSMVIYTNRKMKKKNSFGTTTIDIYTKKK